MEWNTVIYEDCLNAVNGLPTMEANSIELGYTDYPWGSNMEQNIRKYHNRELDNNKGKQFFDDSKETITEEFTLQWFEQFQRVTIKQVLVIPESHKQFWYRNTDPTADVPVLWKNGFSGSKIAKKSKKSTYLFYGKFEKDKKLKFDYIAKQYYTKTTSIVPFTLKWGFCSDQKHFIHPSPKGLDVALHILKMLKPESLLDPFAGSGSYLKAADILRIKWLGFEINPIYKQDIDKRLSQQYIDNYKDIGSSC